MTAALKLFADLGIKPVAYYQAAPAPLETACVAVIDRMIHRYELEHMTLVLRTITETAECNQRALIEPIIGAVSDLTVAHPRWSNLGLEWLAAFDQVDLLQVLKIVKEARAKPLRAGLATLVAIDLAKILGPSRAPKPAKTVNPKLPPKPPRSLTRIPEVERNIELGRQLVALRADNLSNCAYSRVVRARFGIDAQHAGECARVARIYGGRPEVFRRLSWAALLELSASMPTPVRQDLEQRVIAGERISNARIRRARQAHAGRQPADRPRRKVRNVSSRHPDRPAAQMSGATSLMHSAACKRPVRKA